MGKVFNAMVKKRMESCQPLSTKEHPERVDCDFTSSPSINRRKSKRRIHPRAETDWPITIIKNDNPLHGRVKNISRGGALVYFQEEITVGEKFFIAIEVEEFSDVITAEAEVVRSYPVISGMNRSTHGVGIKYITISKECLRFFSGNLTESWGEENNSISYFNTGYISKNSAKNILLMILTLFITFLYFKIEKTEKIYSNKIKSLEEMVVLVKNSVYEIDKQVNRLMLMNTNSVSGINNNIAPGLVSRHLNSGYYFLTNQYITDNFNKKLTKEDVVQSQHKDQAVDDKRVSIGIGGLKVENTYGNLEN